jgi:hypothetical protein
LALGGRLGRILAAHPGKAVLVMPSGAVTLGQIAGRLDRLEIACGKCGRRGSYSVQELIDRHGLELGLPDLAATLSADCEHRGGLAYDRCHVLFTNLTDLLPAR